MDCSDCHDLHRPPPPVKASRRWTDTCAKCHLSESSPRLHPHRADQADGCVACHEPHGTTSPRLLRFARVVDLCLSCHIPPPSHDLSPGGAYASCIACHTEIHGSDADRRLFR
jgi:predicted CXXCH cytochrome family protein